MLTQAQVNKVCKLLKKETKRLVDEPSKVYEQIAKQVGVGMSTVSKLARGTRHQRQLAQRRHILQSTTTKCPEHGVVKGASCVRCDILAYDLPLEELSEGPGPGETDPSPELIALRASDVRRRRTRARAKNRVNFKDPELALWVATSENRLNKVV